MATLRCKWFTIGKYAYGVGFSLSSSGMWWHNIKSKGKGRNYRYDSIIGFYRLYNRNYKVYGYHLTVFSLHLCFSRIKGGPRRGR